MKRSKFMPDILVVEACFRWGLKQRIINGRLDFQVSVDRSVPKFDFERAQPFAVADRGERRRFNWNASDSRDDPGRFGKRREVRGDRNDDDKKKRDCNGGTPSHPVCLTSTPSDWSSVIFPIVIVLVLDPAALRRARL
jgi:hypothetical protein